MATISAVKARTGTHVWSYSIVANKHVATLEFKMNNGRRIHVERQTFRTPEELLDYVSHWHSSHFHRMPKIVFLTDGGDA